MRTSSSQPADIQKRVWAMMQAFVEANSRKLELANTLGFHLGAGRGKVLFSLRNGPMTLSELAQAHGVDAPYATVIVDKLELLGLAERQGHPDDHRRKLVALTLAGSDAIATADAILLQPPTAMQELTEAELNRLEELLSRIGEAPAQPEQDGPAP